MNYRLFLLRLEKSFTILLRPKLLWFALSFRVFPALEARTAFRFVSSDVDCVIDVGANNGQFALVCHLFIPYVRYIAFEPNPQCLNSLSHVLSLFHESKMIGKALDECASIATLNLTNHQDSSSLLMPTSLQTSSYGVRSTNNSIEIACSTLDQEFRESPGKVVFLKIDVQGLELQVLKGGASFLACCSYLLVECSHQILYSSQSLFPEVDEFLREHGFILIATLNRSYSGSTLLQADYLYMGPARD